MTKEEFIEAYCKRSGITWEELSKRRKALPCACGEERCEGWAMMPIDWDEEEYAQLYGSRE